MIFEELRSLVGNERGFIHKKLLGLGKRFAGTALGIIPGGGVIKTGLGIAGGLIGSRFRPSTPRGTVPRTLTARTSRFSEAEKQTGRQIKFSSERSFGRPPAAGLAPGTSQQRVYDQCFAKAAKTAGFAGAANLCRSEEALLRGITGGTGRAPQTFLPVSTRMAHPDDTSCDPPLVRGPRGLCIAPTSPLGASRLFGEAVMGQYGAALVPGSQIVDRATCPRGTQLGNDGLCYNKSQISNKQRMWPAGRKPLLTGGDMRAISTAARAGRRLELATKRLQKMGMMKKPAARGRTPRGHVARLEHSSQH